MKIYILAETCPTIASDGRLLPDPNSKNLVQTADQKAGFTLSREEFPKGFTIFMQVLPPSADDECGRRSSPPAGNLTDHIKKIHFSLDGNLKDSQYYTAIGIVVGWFSMIAAISLLFPRNSKCRRSPDPRARSTHHPEGSTEGDNDNLVDLHGQYNNLSLIHI